MSESLPAHSKVGASGMSRWELDHCPGSVRLSAGLESKAGFAAAEGTVAHSLAEMALNGEDYRSQLGTVVVQDGFEIVVSKAMIDHVTEYKVIVEDMCGADTVRHVEHKFHLADLHPSLFGTSDCVLWHPERQHLDVIDFKYGAGHAVEVENNVQLMYYAVGAVQTLKYPAKTIGLHIVQPRCPHADGPHRTVTIDAIDLVEFAAYLVASVKETEKPDAAVRAGDWCRYCPASGVPGKCPVQEKVVNEMARVAFSPALPYEPEALAKALDQIPILEARIKTLREFAYNEAEAGRVPPRYKLVEKRATEKWKPGITEYDITAAIAVSPDDLYEEPSLKSPAQIRKLVPGKNDKERAAKLAPFTVKESSGHTLVSAEDKRAPVLLSAKAAFSQEA
jgi:hypothetical protein